VWGVSTSFSGLTVENVPTSYPVVQLKHVYFPDTQTGYKFSYSAYGMIYNASMRKQMTIDQNGNITDGTEKAYVSFNYPTGPSSLTDAPAFTQRTEYPAASSGGTAVYSYSTGGSGDQQDLHHHSARFFDGNVDAFGRERRGRFRTADPD
jgi:hypothetical protein